MAEGEKRKNSERERETGDRKTEGKRQEERASCPLYLDLLRLWQCQSSSHLPLISALFIPALHYESIAHCRFNHLQKIPWSYEALRGHLDTNHTCSEQHPTEIVHLNFSKVLSLKLEKVSLILSVTYLFQHLPIQSPLLPRIHTLPGLQVAIS